MINDIDQIGTLFNKAILNNGYIDMESRKQKVRHGKHPDIELLYKYALQELDMESVEVIDTHLLYCDFCSEEVADIIRTEQAIMDFNENNESINTYKDSEIEKPKDIKENLYQSKIDDNVIWLSPLYDKPLRKTAMGYTNKIDGADTENSKTFRYAGGRYFKLVYNYEATGKSLVIQWETDVIYHCDFWIKFFNNENALIGEVCLGNEPKGEKVLSFDKDIGFDLMETDWYIGCALVKRKM